MSIEEVQPGAVIGASVLHPARPELELLSPGVSLEGRMIARLRKLGVTELWVHHDATADLDTILNPRLSEKRLAVYARMKSDFADMSNQTISLSQVHEYRQSIMDLICELISSQAVAGLTDQLFSRQGRLFSHCANVAYLSLLMGLELKPYIIKLRTKLDAEHARDITNLGLGAMMHDLGKVTLPHENRDSHEIHREPGKPAPDGYDQHPLNGYNLLRGTRAPASATQVILNHHQRFDGRGWPDMEAATDNRRSGPQRGGEIHIFTRIVTVANVLDNLLVDAEGKRRPPVQALHTLAGPAYDGWFDPVVRQTMLRHLPPFPVGSLLRLSDGRPAVVIAPSVIQPCRPMVRLLDEAQRNAEGKYPTLNLRDHPAVQVAECAGVNVQPWLFEVPARHAEAGAA